ncbi:hypothetical protein [Sinorhizobium medicae]|uniref:hypothetical protein n=1 Tax=Sinorhizobium medicae TaxID=110321 RepID=UPI000FDAA861|nr:hypothetical protein [Sinorhizobium medicae]MDX0901688.1 hypothetical protein [Sinorhizobium medicae]RVJ84156.1 hypothetical protein CN168_04510 [Sinorhizobium medicae]
MSKPYRVVKLNTGEQDMDAVLNEWAAKGYWLNHVVRNSTYDLRADLFFAQLIAKSSHTSVHAETMIITTAIASSALCITLPRAFP